MTSKESKHFAIEETLDTFKMIVTYQELDITRMAVRRLQDSVLGRFNMQNDQRSAEAETLIPDLEEYREGKSTLELRRDGDFLCIVTNTYGRDVDSDIDNLFGYAGTFFIDDYTNSRMISFLQKSFPNDFERSQSHESLVNDHASGLLDGYIMSGEFFCPEDHSDSFYPALLMLTAYAFPALYKHYSPQAKSGSTFGIFSDMKMSYQSFMNAPTETILADMVFKTRRKSFRKISPKLTVSELSLVNQISSTSTVDDLEIALNQVDFDSEREYVECWYQGIETLSNFSSAVRRRLIKSLFDGSPFADDAFTMVEKYATDYSLFKGVKTVEELHDRAMDLIPEITDDKYLANIPEVISLHQTIEVPETNLSLDLLVNHKEFIVTGKKLKTCIGSASYFEKSIRGESYCYQIFDKEELVGALEIGKDRNLLKVIQCTGFRNSEIDNKDAIFGALRVSLKTTN